jgi:hypothetical protein
MDLLLSAGPVVRCTSGGREDVRYRFRAGAVAK